MKPRDGFPFSLRIGRDWNGVNDDKSELLHGRHSSGRRVDRIVADIGDGVRVKMANANVTMPVSKITKDIHATITVTGLRTMRVRFWLASYVFRLGAWIAGFGSCDIQTERKP